MHRLARSVSFLVVLGFGGVALPACSSSSSSDSTAAAGGTVAESTMAVDTVAADGTSIAASVPDSTPAAASTGEAATDMTTGLEGAKWAGNVKVTIADGTFRFVSDGLPNHERQAEYALPNAGVRVPDASTATAGADPTTAQSYDYSIPTVPTKAASPTDASLGTIGVMISGAALFNPFEGDGSTVAMASNFTVKNAKGEDVAFLDSCNGHPTPMGQYHYHALPKCVTSQVDTKAGPSHIIGVAFDGYLIYGDRDANGAVVTKDQLDACNGISSPTPEFPNGVYHYVLLDTSDSTSSIRCFTGTVDASLTQMQGMGAMPPA